MVSPHTSHTSKNLQTINLGEGVEKRQSFCIVCRNVNWYSHYGEQYWDSLKNVESAAKSHQSWPTLGDPIDGSPPGSPVPGILQARTLEWVAISFSSAWKWKVKVMSLSHVRLFGIPWAEAYPAPPSMGFSRQECWSGVPLPSLHIPWGNHKWRRQCPQQHYLQ